MEDFTQEDIKTVNDTVKNLILGMWKAQNPLFTEETHPNEWNEFYNSQITFMPIQQMLCVVRENRIKNA